MATLDELLERCHERGLCVEMTSTSFSTKITLADSNRLSVIRTKAKSPGIALRIAIEKYDATFP